jgi:ATP adenylyltransferase
MYVLQFSKGGMISCADIHPAATVPFTYFHQTIPVNPSAASLLKIYNELYSRCHSTVQSYAKAHPENFTLHDSIDGSSPFSYNLGMTTTSMILCPRRKEGELIHETGGSEIGFVAFNGTLLAGTLMVKGEKEWNYLREEKGILDTVLDAIGVPRDGLRDQGSVGTKI